MKSPVFVLIICILLFQAPALAAQTTSGSGTVAEVIDVGNYVYLRLEEPANWVATSPFEVTVGDKVTFGSGAEMRDFHSKTLDRSFESILFVPSVSIEGRDIAKMHGAAMESAGAPHPQISKATAVTAPEPGEIKSLEGGKTIAEIYNDSTALEGHSVSLRARVIKVSEDILGKNWITLQDGTGTNPDDNLRATSLELPSPGDVVIANGTVRNNIDIGAGYKYKVLLEEATFSE